MAFRSRAVMRAFTLIELLVVVAIIGLLISILLPSLREAREQSRVGKCLANLRSIGLAANIYRFEFVDLAWGVPSPHYASGNSYTFGVYTEFVWGGDMPDKTAADWASGLQQAQLTATGVNLLGTNNDTYRIPPIDRPLNRYISQSVSWSRPISERVAVRPDTPDFFRCPSERTALVPVVGSKNLAPDADTIYRMSEWWGSSYPINWYWPYYYGSSGDFLLNIGVRRPPGDRTGPVLPGRGKELMLDKAGGSASEFVIFMEGQFNYALADARPPGYKGGPWAGKSKELIGWHGKKNRHIAAFLDGSARYGTFDTRFVLGSGWSIWPNKSWKEVRGAGGGVWKDWRPYNTIAPTNENAYGD